MSPVFFCLVHLREWWSIQDEYRLAPSTSTNHVREPFNINDTSHFSRTLCMSTIITNENLSTIVHGYSWVMMHQWCIGSHCSCGRICRFHLGRPIMDAEFCQSNRWKFSRTRRLPRIQWQIDDDQHQIDILKNLTHFSNSSAVYVAMHYWEGDIPTLKVKVTVHMIMWTVGWLIIKILNEGHG